MAAGKICPRFLSERELPPTGMFFPFALSLSLSHPQLSLHKHPPTPKLKKKKLNKKKSHKVKNLRYELKHKYCLTVCFKAGILA